MKIIKKVDRVEVKRCFVLSQIFTSKNMRVRGVKENMIKFNKETFEKDLKKAKKRVLKLSEKRLDKIIIAENKQRFRVYNEINWFVGLVSVDKIGMWRGAGGVPMSWTKKSLNFTANKLALELNNEKTKFNRIRAFKVVPKIVRSKHLIKKEKYFFPIILPNKTIISCRKGMSKTEGDIDDGNMRALAFAISGDKNIKAYIGVKK